MDDSEMFLYLATKQKGEEKWNYYTKEDLERLDKEMNGKEESDDDMGETEEDEFEGTLTSRTDRTPEAGRARNQ